MKPTWKLLPVVAAAALGLMVLMPGGGLRPDAASADVHDITVNDATVNSGETVTINIDADQNDGNISVSLSGVSSGTSYLLTVTDCNNCADEGDTNTSFSINSTNIAANGNIELEMDITCTGNDTVSINASQGDVSDSVSVQCNANTTPTVTPTVTGTPPTSTPTVTTTPTGDTITLSAVQPNPACGQAVFLFATVKNQAGAFVSGANVSFTSSGGGSFSPTSAVTVTDGVASSTFTPPTTGNTTVTITATTNGKTATASVPVNCGSAAATSTPVPPAATSTPVSQVRPPSTGEAGLADNSSWSLYAGIATVIGTVFAGAVLVARRRA